MPNDRHRAIKRAHDRMIKRNKDRYLVLDLSNDFIFDELGVSTELATKMLESMCSVLRSMTIKRSFNSLWKHNKRRK